jgi:hypothetical protein
MAEFDGMLLKEQQSLEEKQRRDPVPDRTQGTGGTGEGDDGEGSEGSGKGGKKGKSGSAADPSDRSTVEKQADAEAAEGEKGQGTSAAGTETSDTGTGGSHAGRADGGTPVTAPVEGGGAGGTDASPVPADVGDGKSDDVVARQLREAAMKEKDPGVREKLWQEYRDYKKGTGKD